MGDLFKEIYNFKETYMKSKEIFTKMKSEEFKIFRQYQLQLDFKVCMVCVGEMFDC